MMQDITLILSLTNYYNFTKVIILWYLAYPSWWMHSYINSIMGQMLQNNFLSSSKVQLEGGRDRRMEQPSTKMVSSWLP